MFYVYTFNSHPVANSSKSRLDESYVVFANRSVTENRISFTCAPDNKRAGKFVLCTSSRHSPIVRALAVLWVDDFFDFASLLNLANLDPSESERLGRALEKFDSQILHSDIPRLVEKLTSNTIYYDSPLIIGGGLMSMDHENRIIFVGLGSSKGVLPKKFLSDAFYDLSVTSGYSLFCFSNDVGAVARNSPEEEWFKKFGI